MHYLNRIARLARRPGNIPPLLAGLGHNLANDVRALAGWYGYPHKVIFIAGLPKSGTTWMQNQLARVPGYNIRRVRDPEGSVNTRDVNHAIFESLPKNCYSIVKLHTRYSEQNLAVILAHTSRFVVMIRDLRDMCVSRYFHAKQDPDNHHHALYNSLPQDEGLSHCIEIVGKNYVPWVRDWFRVAQEHKGAIKLVTYEQLSGATLATFRGLLEFFGVAPDPELLQSMQGSRMTIKRDLADQLARNTWLVRSTEREGEIGSWRRYFTPAQTARFKELGGTVLLTTGYEQHMDW